MKIKKSHTQNKLILCSAIVVVIAVAGYVASAITYDLWPFEKLTHSTMSEDQSKSDNTARSKKNGDKTDTTGQTKTNNPPTDKGYVDTPISNPPKVTDPYPIENEHYKISQDSATNYQITLYPIANNPEHSDYIAQLRLYKSEALNYLKSRYGKVDNLTIEWTPSEASDL